MNSKKYYCGIGARTTPPDLQDTFDKIAGFLVKCGYTLRSGAADGADKMWEDAQDRVNGEKEIYLPWKKFNDHPSQLLFTEWNWAISSKYHPYWDSLGVNSRCFMARNCCQVLGMDEDDPNSSFVLCWTPDGEEVGGTAQALRIAKAYKIPIFNFGKKNALARFRTYCRKNEL